MVGTKPPPSKPSSTAARSECHHDDEDTLLSEQECTGWIRLLLDQANFVADVYCECGEWLATKSSFAESF